MRLCETSVCAARTRQPACQGALAAAGHRVHGIESTHDEDNRQWVCIGRLEGMLLKAS